MLSPEFSRGRPWIALLAGLAVLPVACAPYPQQPSQHSLPPQQIQRPVPIQQPIQQPGLQSIQRIQHTQHPARNSQTRSGEVLVLQPIERWPDRETSHSVPAPQTIYAQEYQEYDPGELLPDSLQSEPAEALRVGSQTPETLETLETLETQEETETQPRELEHVEIILEVVPDQMDQMAPVTPVAPVTQIPEIQQTETEEIQQSQEEVAPPAGLEGLFLTEEEIASGGWLTPRQIHPVRGSGPDPRKRELLEDPVKREPVPTNILEVGLDSVSDFRTEEQKAEDEFLKDYTGRTLLSRRHAVRVGLHGSARELDRRHKIREGSPRADCEGRDWAGVYLWEVKAGESLKRTVRDWTESVCWVFVDRTALDWVFQAGIVFEGDYISVSAKLMETMAKVRPSAPRLHFYGENFVVKLSDDRIHTAEGAVN